MTHLSQNKVHFIGIGGIGMSALARYFLSEKWAVSGSDVTKSQITDSLTKDGIKLKIGHKKGHLPRGVNLVVVNLAIPANNPELRETRRRGVRVLTYPEAVGELTEQYKTIAIAGAHGKSTTTALAALTLVRGGLDPTVIVGTNLREFGGGKNGRNFRRGRGEYLVLEADEFGNAFLRYSPFIAIVTNIDREHLDTHKDLAGVKKAFLGFTKNVASGGTLILNHDDKNIVSLKSPIARIAQQKNVRMIWFSLHDPDAKKIKRAIKISGVHNISNALAVYKLGKVLGIQEKKVLAAIGAYRGAWRRMEYRGRFGGKDARRGALVYDDYAHHPTEIKATLKAFHEKYPHKKILCVFQPHQAKRLAALFKEFTTAFAAADKTLLLPIYKVAGRDEKPSRFDSAALARTIQKREPRKPFFYLANPRNLKKAIRTLTTPLSQYIIVMMGAGDIVKLTDLLI